MLKRYLIKIKNYKLKREWKKRNKHNYTSISRANSLDYIEVGNYTYGVLNVHISNNSQKLKIGNFCSIASNVFFLLSADHSLNTISTYPFKSQLLGIEQMEGKSKGNIIIDDDVWIGYGAIILSGVHIGQGAVVAAGAVVTKDIPPYAIVGGNPARVIRYRFSSDIIAELNKIDYSGISREIIEKNIDILYANITETNINKINSIPQR